MGIVTVTVSGKLGVGKSAILHEIAATLQEKFGNSISVEFANNNEAQSEINMGMGDPQHRLGNILMYQPHVVLIEKMDR